MSRPDFLFLVRDGTETVDKASGLAVQIRSKKAQATRTALQ